MPPLRDPCSDVQSMLHKRRLGPKGMHVFKSFEQSITNGWDWAAAKVGKQRVGGGEPAAQLWMGLGRGKCVMGGT